MIYIIGPFDDDETENQKTLEKRKDMMEAVRHITHIDILYQYIIKYSVQ